MASANYITSADLTDTILTGFTMTAYITRANDAIENLAREFGVSVTSIVTPIDYNIKLWAVYWLMKEFLREVSFKNSNTEGNDKYVAKHQIYYEECNRMQRKLSYEMFTGNATGAVTASATSGKMLRG